MQRASIARLRRIMRLTDLMYEIEVRAIAELKQEQAELDAEIEATREFLGTDGVAATLFPSLVARRIGRLRHDRAALEGALGRRIESAIGARAGSIGIANRVEQELQRRKRSIAAASLDEVADRVARERTASLRQGPADRLAKSD